MKYLKIQFPSDLDVKLTTYDIVVLSSRMGKALSPLQPTYDVYNEKAWN